MILSRFCSITLAPNIAGTLQPKPIIIGTKDFPDNPKNPINLSIKTIALAI